MLESTQIYLKAGSHVPSDRIQKLRQQVHSLYKTPLKDAAPWASWMFDGHVSVVASYAEQLAKQHQANPDWVIAGALLHDIADVFMTREDQIAHEGCSENVARELLNTYGFEATEVDAIITKIIAPHSCMDLKPKTLEGKILATADAMAHFRTNFYLHFCWTHEIKKSLKEYKAWVCAKIDRDYTQKIFFEEIRQGIKLHYEALKLLFNSALL